MEKENLKLKGEINESRWRKHNWAYMTAWVKVFLIHTQFILFALKQVSVCLLVSVPVCMYVCMCTDIGWGVFYQCKVHHFCFDPVGMHGHKPRGVPHLTCMYTEHLFKRPPHVTPSQNVGQCLCKLTIMVDSDPVLFRKTQIFLLFNVLIIHGG